MEAQKMVHGRHKKISQEYEDSIKKANEKILKERLESKSTQPQNKTSLWDMVTGLFK
tara:strand:+ start:403 stop:573 length:171 start_codon:yes stop_codon:yes gene_type:complete